MGGIQGLKLGEMVAERWMGGDVEIQTLTVTEGGGRDLCEGRHGTVWPRATRVGRR